MGTISEKLTYLNDTKGLLKDKINNLGGSIDDNTTFRQYANQLQNVYDNLPKTEYQEGSNITLSNTLKGKLDFEDGIVGYGDTKQEGTPTPDNPQDIEVVRGKNLAQLEFENGYRNSGSGEIISTGSFCSFIAEVSPNNEYYASNAHSNLCYLDINKNRIGGIAFSGGGLFNTNNMSNVAYVSVAVENSKKDSIQIEKGSQATSYLPYNTVEIETENENILPLVIDSRTSATGITITRNEDNSYKVSGTATALNLFSSTNSMILKANTTYTLGLSNGNNNVQISLRNNSGTQLVNTDTTKFVTYTPNEDVEVRLFIRVANGATVDETIYPMLVYGNIVLTEYIQHQETIYQLSLGEYEFAKIGNYVDTIEYDVENDKVYKNEVIGKKILNGGNDENWAYETAYNRFGLTETINDYNITLRTTAICNYYRYGDTSIDNYFALSSNGKLALFHAPTNISTLAEWKTWLSTNNLILYYILETAIKEEITGTLKDQIKALYYSQSFTGTTIIEIDGQLPLIIKVRGLKGE